MWNAPWRYKEGCLIGAGLFTTGLLLQGTVGRIDWSVFAYPVNTLVGIVFVAALVVMHCLRKRVYCFRWMSHYTAAVSALLWVAGITVAMGFSQMISAWPFVLLYLWLVTMLGLTVLRAGFPFRWKRLPFLLNHAGLFIALIAATLGNADMQRLRMITKIGNIEWRAMNESGQLVELPLAIELQDFTIDEYPPKLMLIDNETGHALPEKVPVHLLLEEGVTGGQLEDWQVTIRQTIPWAASVSTTDTLKFTAFHSVGATYAVYLQALNRKTKAEAEGWVSCGSFLFPYKALRLDSLTSLVMPEREPRRFVSAVKVYTKSGQLVEDTIEVNRPLSVAGWEIYQLNYDKAKGRWSDISVFELVRDPWLPAVYAGILLMALGAVGLFIGTPKRKEEDTE